MKSNGTRKRHHLCVPGTVASSKGSKVLSYLDDVKAKSWGEFCKTENVLRVSGCGAAAEEGRAFGAGRPGQGQS